MTTIPAGVTTVALGNQAHEVAVNAAGTRAAVSIDSGGLQVVDLTTSPPSLVGPVVEQSIVADPLGVPISADGMRAIHVKEQSPASAVIVVDITGSNPALVATVPLAGLSPSAVASNPVTGAALIARDDGVAILIPP